VVVAELAAAALAVAAVAARDVAFAGHSLPHFQALHAGAERGDLPMNSWPTTIGTGMVACAHASQ
jgi:hypothetical protein